MNHLRYYQYAIAVYRSLALSPEEESVQPSSTGVCTVSHTGSSPADSGSNTSIAGQGRLVAAEECMLVAVLALQLEVAPRNEDNERGE